MLMAKCMVGLVVGLGLVVHGSMLGGKGGMTCERGGKG